MKEIILASSSPRRKELLAQIGVPFRIITSDVEEDPDKLDGDPEAKAEKLALLKARDVARRLEEGLVLGADTMVVLDERIFGKPKDEGEAFSMLSELSGKEHRVITGVAVVDAKSGYYETSHETTGVKFSHLTEEKIRAYIKRTHCLDKAGAYGIQDLGALFVERISGCYFNVVGLPLLKVARLLERFGYPVL